MGQVPACSVDLFTTVYMYVYCVYATLFSVVCSVLYVQCCTFSVVCSVLYVQCHVEIIVIGFHVHNCCDIINLSSVGLLCENFALNVAHWLYVDVGEVHV